MPLKYKINLTAAEMLAMQSAVSDTLGTLQGSATTLRYAEGILGRSKSPQLQAIELRIAELEGVIQAIRNMQTEETE